MTTLTLKEPPRAQIDLSSLTPERLAGKSEQEIAALELNAGNRRLRVADLFNVSGDEADSIVIENSCDKLTRIGAGMRRGNISVRGDVGAYLGYGMRGGNLTLEGNAGGFAACAMIGGFMRILGNCGDFVGAALPGERRGMRGGTVIVHGSAGDRVGDFMRRGAILIENDAGDYCGSRMIAGTVAVLGEIGESAGWAMQRGTLLLAKSTRPLLSTFNDCGTHELNFLPLLLRSWRGLPGRFGSLELGSRVRRYMGDVANGGKGEILVWA